MPATYHDILAEAAGIIVIILFGLSSLVAYMTPALIAYWRKHRSTMAITAANFMFGWSVAGWALCLIWALTGDVKKSN